VLTTQYLIVALCTPTESCRAWSTVTRCSSGIEYKNHAVTAQSAWPCTVKSFQAGFTAPNERFSHELPPSHRATLCAAMTDRERERKSTLYIHTCIYMHICIYIYIYIYVYRCIYTPVFIQYIHVYVYTCICTSVFTPTNERLALARMNYHRATLFTSVDKHVSLPRINTCLMRNKPSQKSSRVHAAVCE